VGPEVAERLGLYWSACRRLWNRAEHDGSLAGPCVRIERLVCQAQQETGRNKVDLVAHLEGLRNVAGVGAILDDVLGDHPAGDATVTVTGAPGVYPRCLGGAPSPGEIERRFVIDVRYASWRDRPVRRLARIQVWVDEIWPDPAAV
jgi:hypothetical protein